MNKIILVLSLLFMIACSPLEIREDSRISKSYVDGYHRVTFVTTGRVRDVRLEGVPIEGETQYYIKGDKYLLTYEYIPTFSIGMEVAYNREDRNGGDNDYTGLSRERELLTITEDKIIRIKGKNVEINFSGEAGS